MTVRRLAKRPLPPLRLVVVHPDEGVSIYEGRERITTLRTDFPYNAAQIEDLRVANYDEEPA